MFRDTAIVDHDEWVSRARAAASRIDIAEIGDAFLASLESRRLDLRSALGSYAVARHLPSHEFTPDARGRACRVCGLFEDQEEDLNVLNFERFKWGGVRRDDVAYLAFDLEQFENAPRVPLTEAGKNAGRHMVTTLRSAAADDTATKVAPRLKSFAGNKAEREVTVDILGVCGVLRAAKQSSCKDDFVPYDSRPSPDHHFVERAYPVCWWRGSDGVDTAALTEFLPAISEGVRAGPR